MKKLIILFVFVLLTLGATAQGLFKPVPKDLFTQPKYALKATTGGTHVWLWRFDATINLTELTWDKATKQFVSNSFSAVGPGIGYKHFVPVSSTDPTPFENYGFSAALLLGTNIYTPDFSKIKIALEADLFQYLKAGVTFTGNTKDWFGIFFGSGITF